MTVNGYDVLLMTNRDDLSRTRTEVLMTVNGVDILLTVKQI